MNEQQAVESTSNFDSAKLTIATALVIGGIFAFYWFDNQSVWLRSAYVAGGTLLGLFTAWQTALGRATLSFILTSRNEVRKMVWPTRQETMTTTLFVLFTVLVVGVFMWGLDALLILALRGLTGQGA